VAASSDSDSMKEKFTDNSPEFFPQMVWLQKNPKKHPPPPFGEFRIGEFIFHRLFFIESLRRVILLIVSLF
jgi:hypothetical protein